MQTIRKIGAIIIHDRKILVCKKRGTYIIPGGKPEEGENAEECLKRELREELGVSVLSHKFFGTFKDEAALDSAIIEMDVYIVEIAGKPEACREIEEIMYIDSKSGVKLGSILRKFVIPGLVKKGLME